MSVIKIDLNQEIKSKNELDAVLALIPLVSVGNVTDGLVGMAREYLASKFLTGEERTAYEHSLSDARKGLVKAGSHIRLTCTDAPAFKLWETHPWEDEA